MRDRRQGQDTDGERCRDGGRRDTERHPQEKQARRQTVTYTQTHPLGDGERQEDIRDRDAARETERQRNGDREKQRQWERQNG